MIDIVTDTRRARSTSTGTVEDRCFAAVEDFLGSGSTMRRPDDWYVPGYLASTVTMIGPDRLQLEQGQRWVACAVVPMQASASSGVLEPYSQTLRDAVRTGNLRDHFGWCPSPDTRGAGACATPHRAELFGTRPAGTDVTDRAQAARVCADRVRERTGLDEPTLGGQLRVTTVVTDRLKPVDTDTITAEHVLECGLAVTGDRLLGGSLINIGTDPIPWA